MKILVFDKDYSIDKNDYLAVLINNLSDYHITLTRSFNEAIKLFRDNVYQIVLIDFTTIDGKEFLQEVNRLNSLQRIITMGYTLSCSSEMGCDYCLDNFHKRRLIKPIDSIELYKTILNFDDIKCKYANTFNEPKMLIDELLNRYDSFSYNLSTQMIESKDIDIHELKEFLDLIVDLKNYHIDFKIIDEKSIKII